MKDLLRTFIGKRVMVQIDSMTDTGVLEKVHGDYIVLKHLDKEDRAILAIANIKGFTEEIGGCEGINKAREQGKSIQ